MYYGFYSSTFSSVVSFDFLVRGFLVLDVPRFGLRVFLGFSSDCSAG